MKNFARDPAALTPREMQVLYLIVCGRSARDVAGVLRISQHTVRRHRRCIYEKLCVRNVAELLRAAILEGWLGTRPYVADAPARRLPSNERHAPALRPALRLSLDGRRLVPPARNDAGVRQPV